ncbi:MAG: UDP-N-acetylmuramoylalanyl-D-glutamate--2,6-diaminopimelate ligase [Raoultibacter sp.]
MGEIMQCPACGATDFDLAEYESMMVLRADSAFFTLRCPTCSTMVSAVAAIPASLREEVRFAALEVGAGMGHES